MGVSFYSDHQRSESLHVLQHQYGDLEGPEPKQVDVPQRRSSLASRSGGSNSIVTAAVAALPDSDDSPSPPTFRKELSRQESEAALLASVGGLSAVSRVFIFPCFQVIFK